MHAMVLWKEALQLRWLNRRLLGIFGGSDENLICACFGSDRCGLLPTQARSPRIHFAISTGRIERQWRDRPRTAVETAELYDTRIMSDRC